MKLVEIKNWSDERLITQNTPSREGFNAMIVEELYERISLGILKNDTHQIVDAVCDNVVFSVGEIYKFGYNCELLLGEGDIIDWLPFQDNELQTELTQKGLDYTSRCVYYLGTFLDAHKIAKKIAEDGDDLESLTREIKIQAMRDMIIDSFDELITLGFDPDKCMDEVMKELNSRTGEYCDKSKKWQKYTTPEAEALWYKADFTECTLND